MFVSVREQGRWRRSHTYGVSKAARSSKLSLLSAITAGSHGSNDSASTITQESYLRSSSGSGKRRRTSKTKRPQESRKGKLGFGKNSLDQARKGKSKSQESVDVFEFLVHDDNQDTAGQQPQEAARGETEPESPPGHEESDTECLERSLHSDSGVSMGDNSVYHLSNDHSFGRHLPPLLEESQGTDGTRGQLRSRPPRSPTSRWEYPDIPPARHNTIHCEPYNRPGSPDQRRIRFLCHPNESTEEARVLRTRLSGYDLVADQLSQGELPPVFRRFSKIHFRVLLQMQDEIVEMEQELASLDLADTESRVNADGSTLPASRRIDWQWNVSDLHARRLEVLGRLYVKLEQYYQALVSGQKVQRLSSPAVSADLARFRTWLQEHNPLSLPESKFLEDDDDLLSLKETSVPLPQRSEARSDLIPLCIVTMALFPLLCFKFITGVLNRMILLAALLAAGLSSLERLDPANFEQHQQWLMACLGASLVAALIF